MMADEFNHISSIRAGERPIHAESRVTSSRLAIAATVVGLVFSFVAAGVVGRWENSTSKVEFDGVAKNQTIILQSGINEYLARLLALRTLFETFNAQITRSEFDVFNTRLFEEHPGILRVNWVPRVTREERVGFEKAAVLDGVAGYQIKAVASDGALVSAPERDEYFPILYSTVPTTSVIYGSDLASQMQKHDTINRARDDDAVAVLPDAAWWDNHAKEGIFVAVPVYLKGMPHSSVADRRRNIAGFIIGRFDLANLLVTVLSTTPASSGVNLDIYPPGKDVGEPPIHRPLFRLSSTSLTKQPVDKPPAEPQWSSVLKIGDVTWKTLSTPAPGSHLAADYNRALFVLAAGFLITALVVIYLRSMSRYWRRLALANRRGLDLAQRLDTAINNMSQGLVLFDAQERLVVCNNLYIEMYGLSREIVKPGCSFLEILRYRAEVGDFLRHEPEAYRNGHLAAMALGKVTTLILEGAEGREVLVTTSPMADGGWVATHEDITERRRAAAKIEYMAHHDALTGLPNRLQLYQQLQQTLEKKRQGVHVAVLCLDLDRFKAVNDAYGHPLGDLLLKTVADRLRQCVRETDIVARLGGDEFAIMQAGASQPTDATALASRLVEVVGAPYELCGQQAGVELSIGIALAPGDGLDPDQLLKNADLALYRAKSDGSGLYRFFEPGMDARMQARRTLEIDLRRAIANGEFELFYQPLVDMRTEHVTGFEALIRWRHPQRGLIVPLDFIAIAEETGLIVPIGDWVLRQACAEAATWPDDVKVAVNLSPIQFKSRALLLSVVSALATSGLSPNRLELEITESVLLREGDATLALLNELRGLGVRISMDDFGTGYSSLSYLRKFPFDKIKIDQSFIFDMSDHSDSLAIVRAVIAMGSGLGIATTAEGVETAEQFKQLKLEGCTEVQGYLFSPPRPAAEVKALLASINPSLKAIA